MNRKEWELSMTPKHILPNEWENRNSPSSILPSFLKALKSDDLQRNLQSLYCNLSEKDKGIISRILNCFFRLLSKEQPETIFTSAESDEINNYLSIIQNRIIKLKEDLYCFNGYFLPISHFAPDLFISRLSYDLLDNPMHISDKDIIDAGGYVGDSALIMSSWTSGRVHVFEPISSHKAQVEKTIQYNNLTNCLLVPKGLGETKAEVEIAFFGSGSSINKFDKIVFDALKNLIIN
ncbi:MAG: hypothetical protein FWG97_01160 [Deltaproteobacteria bacterium]|nr:hypothetical protein [Deltaproteobacteria bacterium]